jgi:uncharacterized membrane protein YeaQ/YmgE (transglycosylase-associated protein family)
MNVVLYLVLLVFLGLATGAFARLALPGPDPMSVLQTTALGLAGSFIAGLIGLALWGSGAPGALLSLACSTVILYFIRRAHGGGLSRPAAPTELDAP